MSGPLWLTPDDRQDTLPVIPRPRPRWAAADDPMEELADRLRDLIEAAVHPDEIAAILESDGMTDDHIRLTYGRTNSFELAEDLYDRVPRTYPEPALQPGDPWHVALLPCLLRGLVFALPGLAYVLGAPFATGAAPIAVLVAGALTGWAWNQALAHRAYTWLGLGDRPAAARALLVGAPLGALVGTGVAFAAAGAGEGPAVVFASAQALYQAAATVLLVLGRERLLLAALAPMSVGAVVALAYDIPDAARLVLLAVSPLAVLVLATAELVRGVGGRRMPGGPRLVSSLPYGLFGLATGVLVLYAALGGAESGAEAAPGAVALTLSMGPAEWLLHRFRSGALAGLRRSTTPGEFRGAALGTLARCLGQYLLVLGALAVLGTLVWPSAGGFDEVRFVALLVIGTLMWTGLLLQAFGAVLVAAGVCGVAALGQSLAVLGGTTPGVSLLAPGAAALLLSALAYAFLGRATAHRG
ncbi:hypothetical protein GCM10010329_13550 [Streptomyces spiroverticillatus]|uniref:Uncharacterized protein n=1 Tax=Streptomyces finlayi TaxID=67296 RepID=A0A918WX13_9ACTN|nr:hypothetical protein [Streptomyces finlayi]GGZ93752.1 hypothetical protein GCM10010329_13550 [Streptomyces spiroverticillatus]GHC92079.1 hypothetical protein GCM10010334_27550 [Streptomyces finlayi]